MYWLFKWKDADTLTRIKYAGPWKSRQAAHQYRTRNGLKEATVVMWSPEQ